MCEARATLEKIAAKGARLTYAANPRALARLDAAIDKMDRAARNNDQLEVNKADIEFHREICRASGNEVVMTLWAALARLTFVILAHEALDLEGLQKYVEVHRELRTAVAFGEEPLAERIDQHILNRNNVHVRLWHA